MSRSTRRITPWLRSLLLGAELQRSPLVGALAAGAAVMAMGAVVAGCADENLPATHVKKLSDPATRPAAVNRLIQFFEDAMTRDKGERSGPAVKPLLDLIVQPMTETCVAGDLDDRTNLKLIKFLSDTRDPKAEPCIVKALKDYKIDATEEDVRSAARAVAALKLQSAAGPLFEVFTKIKASKPKASTTYRDVHDAMVVLLDKSWEPQLITYLGRPVDPKDGNLMRDELYWQITAAEVLGLMKSTAAVKPLIKMILSPSKADAGTTAVLALVKIGKPSIGPAVSLLNGADKDLIDYSRTETMKLAGEKPTDATKKAAETAYIGTAALILATIGREESAAPLMEALSKPDKDYDVPRAIIGRELTKLPKTPTTIKAFQDAFEKTPPSLSIPPGIGARETLLEASGMFFDPTLVPWIVKSALLMKGEEGDITPIREASLSAAMKLMTPDQLKTVEDLYNTRATIDNKVTVVGKGFEKEFKLAKALLTACETKLDCYLNKLAEPASQKEDTQFQGIKSAYMVGALGNADTRQKIIDLMPKITNAAVRFVSVSAIDQLSPKGDTAIAAKLQKIVDDADATRDASKIASNAPFKTVIYRLNARAQ
jgi:HEAT repeat protein